MLTGSSGAELAGPALCCLVVGGEATDLSSTHRALVYTFFRVFFGRPRHADVSAPVGVLERDATLVLAWKSLPCGLIMS